MEDLLDVVRIEAEVGALHRVPIEPFGLLCEVADAHRTLARDKEVTLEVEPAGQQGLVNVDLTRKDRATFEAFESTVAAFDEVIEVRRMFGLPDYLIRVATASLESYETFVSTRLGDVPGVDKLDSHLTMKLIKSPDHAVSGGPLPARKV